MFPLRYCLAQQGLEEPSPLGFPPAAFTAFSGTIRLSDCPHHIDKLMFCLPPTQQRQPAGIKFISVLNGCPAALLSTLRLFCYQHRPKTRFRWCGRHLTERDFHPHNNAPLFRGALCDKLFLSIRTPPIFEFGLRHHPHFTIGGFIIPSSTLPLTLFSPA